MRGHLVPLEAGRIGSDGPFKPSGRDRWKWASGNLKVGAGVSTSTREIHEDDHLHDATSRLMSRTAVIETRLGQRLEAVRGAFDLAPRALLSSHRQVHELNRLGVAPSPIDYWSVTANPVGQALVHAATPVIEEELEHFEGALNRFNLSVAVASKSRSAEPSSAAGPSQTTGLSTSLQARSTRDECCARIMACALDAEPLNRLGRRWQGRLRRAAIRSALPQLLLASARDAEKLIAVAEVELLDQAPWAHDDRLLSAFELAHADVRVLLRDRLAEISVVVPSRTRRKLDTSS